jgi:hypothetical protein
MSKSGLIVGIFSFFLVLGISVGLTPLCSPCLTIFLGLAAGYFAGVFDQPASRDAVTKIGLNAGLIAGGMAFVAQILASVINGILVGPSGAAAFGDALGLGGTIDASSYYTSLILLTLCIGVLNVGIMAGLGALGGMAWWNFSGKNISPSEEVITPDL